MQKLQIDASTWATLNRLLDEALEQPQTRRDQWLHELAPQFESLKPRLRELLARTGAIETGEFLQTLPKLELAPAETADAARGEAPGQEIGPYRLIRELGSGGMGVVWLAERTDGLINRPVALKLPHGAWKRAGLAERMAREREILATLTHPNIAHLYDAGVTADGQPYLAIEFVEGLSIDVYCRERRLDVRARLRLFAQVAGAVAFAHGKLVVHRDLKPANILVNAQEQARLLDFGIAKLLEDGETRETRLTEITGRALTPDYASPEQILGEPLTIASDVYSLGVILYELLCGVRPYKLRRDSRAALEEAILLTEPAPPSELLAAPARKLLRGDLDTVVLKALKKVPADRYPTVHALLDDIERYLGARPVLAQPDSRWYRTRKFVARNKLGVGAAGAVFVTILAGAGVATWQARVAIAEKNRAEEVKEFIAAVFREADPNQGQGKALSAQELLRQAERRLREQADASPELRLELLTIVGESLFGLQEVQDSARVMEEALRLEGSGEPRDKLLAARTHMGLSQAYHYLGRHAEALAQLESVFTLLSGSGRAARPLLAQAKLHRISLRITAGEFAQAEVAANEAIRTASAEFGPQSPEVAAGLHFLSQVCIFTDRAPLAVEHSRKALDLMLASYNGDLAHPKVIDSALYHEEALMQLGKFDAAAALLRELTAKAAGSLGSESRMAGDLHSASATAEIESGNPRAAIVDARRAIEIQLKESDPEAVVVAFRARILGHALLSARAGTEAVAQLDEAVKLSAASKSRLGVLQARATHGLSLALVGRLSEAQRELREVVGAARAGSRLHFQAMRYLGTSLRLAGSYAESLEWLDKSATAAATKRLYGSDMSMSLTEAGLARLELGELDAAQQLFSRAESSFNDFQAEHTSPARADLFTGVARLRMQQRDFAAALPPLQKADQFWREFAPENRWAGETALWLGRCYLALGREAEGNDALQRAAKLLAASPLPMDVGLVRLARRTLSP